MRHNGAMSLYRWSLGFLSLGALLLALGLLPEFIAGLVGLQSAVTIMLLLLVAPLGAFILAVGLVMVLFALLRNGR